MSSQIPLSQVLEMRATNGGDLIMCNTVMPSTPSGKIELFSEDLEQRFGYGVPQSEPVEQTRPFVLITPSSSKRTNATFGGSKVSARIEVLEINPEDAKANGIKSGDTEILCFRCSSVGRDLQPERILVPAESDRPNDKCLDPR